MNPIRRGDLVDCNLECCCLFMQGTGGGGWGACRSQISLSSLWGMRKRFKRFLQKTHTHHIHKANLVKLAVAV